MPLPGANGCSEDMLSSWDELDRLIDQLRSMVILLQSTQISWTENSMLSPYMQTMDDMLARVSFLQESLRRKMGA